MEKVAETPDVTRYSIVRIVPHELLGKRFLLLTNRRMPIPLAPLGYLLQGPREAPPLGLFLYHPLPFTLKSRQFITMFA